MTTANAARPEDQGDASARMTACPHDGPVPHRVLIVDDDRAIRESLARALELEGYQVDVVVDGVAALARTRRETFDALVVDVMMPGVDGLGVCRVQGPRSRRGIEPNVCVVHRTTARTELKATDVTRPTAGDGNHEVPKHIEPVCSQVVCR